MKIPEKAPKWQEVFSDPGKMEIMFKEENIEKLNNFVKKVEQKDEYAYWDKVKHFEMPEGISPRVAWAFLKFSRGSKLDTVSLISQGKNEFQYWITDSILKNLSFVDKHTSGEILVEETNIHKAEQKKYLISSLMEEAIASSLLEGAATTRKEAKKMLRSGRNPKTKAEQMVFNNYQTILKIKNLTKRKLTKKLLLDLHSSMTANTLENPEECGRFRISEDDKIYVRDKEENTLYEPPRPEQIDSMLEMLYSYANDSDEKNYTHPAIKAINLHFYLSYIHPFMDGNGRTARALFYWYMMKTGYWMFEYLTISKIFLSAPSRYARAFLYTEIDDLDLTYFISFHLRAVRIAIERLVEHIKSKQKEEKENAVYLRKFPELNERQKSLVKHALRNPDYIYIISEHKSIHSVTYESARRDLTELERSKFLIRSKKGKTFIFTPVEKLDSIIKKRKEK